MIQFIYILFVFLCPPSPRIWIQMEKSWDQDPDPHYRRCVSETLFSAHICLEMAQKVPVVKIHIPEGCAACPWIWPAPSLFPSVAVGTARAAPPGLYKKHRMKQCCESKYIDFGSSGFRILVQFGSGSKVMVSILKEKIKNNFKEKQFSLIIYFF